MGTTLDISSSSRLLPVSSERKAHLKQIGFQKSKSGNLKGRPKLDETVRDIARIYSSEAVVKLIKIMRNPKSSLYLQMQASRTLLSMGFHKNKSIRELNVLRIWKNMEFHRLTGLGMGEGRANELVEAQCSKDPTIKQFAQRAADTEWQELEQDENYVWDL